MENRESSRPAALVGAEARQRSANWKQYAFAPIVFNAVPFVFGFVVLSLQPVMPRGSSALARHRGQVLTHHQLFQEVCGPLRENNDHYLRIYMGHLRQKLESDPGRPEHIVTQTGVGYRLLGGSAGGAPSSPC